jgi:hypothetical protein
MACGGEETSNLALISSGQGASSQGGSGTGATTTTASGGNANNSSSTVGSGGGVMGNYPPPPYGVEEGDTFPFLDMQGYPNVMANGVATNQPFGNFSSDDIRNSGHAHVLIHLAAMF